VYTSLVQSAEVIKMQNANLKMTPNKLLRNYTGQAIQNAKLFLNSKRKAQSAKLKRKA